ncbi:MAG: 50S ribosomal protein L11 methyltransferase [Dehalococcoidia bacterium]
MPTPDDRWFQAVARLDARDAEAVADAMSVAGAAGVSIEPALLIRDDADFAYDELTDQPWTVRGSFPAPFGADEQAAVRRAIDALTLSAPLDALDFSESATVDWAEEWKRFYRVQHIGSRLVVRPSWEPYDARPGEVVLELDPGTAFGTGEHETTRLCLVAIERHVFEDASVLDVGAGSGILAIAARLLGAGEVRAVDIDADTVEVARDNAQRNGVADAIAFAAGSVGDDWPWPERAAAGYDLVLANISSLVIGRLAGHLAAAVAADGLLVASGFILRDVQEVRGILDGAGLVEVEYEHEGDWGCLVMRRG